MRDEERAPVTLRVFLLAVVACVSKCPLPFRRRDVGSLCAVPNAIAFQIGASDRPFQLSPGLGEGDCSPATNASRNTRARRRTRSGAIPSHMSTPAAC